MNTNYVTSDKKEGIIMYKIDSIKDQYETLEPGIYNLVDYSTMMAEIPGFVPAKTPDNLINFKSGIFAEASDILNAFFSEKTKNVYAELGIGYKVGMIFHGKPGTGKTSLCQLIMQTIVIEHGAICLICTDQSISFVHRTISAIRKIQDNPICVFVDEIDENIKAEENRYLTFLDGNDSFTNIAVIGCTNYLDRIPDRIKNRKSRIKYLFQVDALPDDIYQEYLISKIGKTWSKDVAEFVHYAAENKLTIDQLKHAITDFVIEGKSIAKACEEVAKY